MSIKDHVPYGGFTTFSWLTDLTGIPLDKVNFILVYITSFVLAGILRSSLSPEKVTPATRHVFCITFGLIFSYFCFGKDVIHLIGFPTVCYCVIITQDSKFIHIQVFVVALLYNSYLHLYSQIFNYCSFDLDIRGPIMIMAGKVTSLACSLHDGNFRPEKELTPMQKRHIIKERPSILEFYSFFLSFFGLLAGPATFYDEYIDFIQNRSIQDAKLRNKNFSEKEFQSSMKAAALKKLCLGICMLLVPAIFLNAYDFKNIIDDEFLMKTSMLYKIWYVTMSTQMFRFNYYFAWTFIEAVSNNAGYGFNGLDENGQARWDLLTNVNILKIETASNINSYSRNWNKVTIRWLKFVVYERVPYFKSFISFITSTVWHGFYPGYYLSMVQGILYMYTASSFRKHIRPYFQRTKILKWFYDLLTILATRIALSYFALSFIILEFEPTWRIFRDVYFFHVILPLLATILLPILLPVTETKAKSEANYDHRDDNNREDEEFITDN